MTAIQLKQFINRILGIPKSKLRATSGDRYCHVTIIPERRHRQDFKEPIRYAYQFTPELGNRCMRIVYKGHESLCAQNWGGNITSHSIAMLSHEWKELIEQYEHQNTENKMA